MTTTSIVEKEKEIRRKIRIKEVIEKDGISYFYPQHKIFGIWIYFYDNFLDFLFAENSEKEFSSLLAARNFINRYVDRKLSHKKIIYHNVNYLTH